MYRVERHDKPKSGRPCVDVYHNEDLVARFWGHRSRHRAKLFVAADSTFDYVRWDTFDFVDGQPSKVPTFSTFERAEFAMSVGLHGDRKTVGIDARERNGQYGASLSVIGYGSADVSSFDEEGEYKGVTVNGQVCVQFNTRSSH